MAAAPECLELPRPGSLLQTIGWNIVESFGLPTGAYAVAAWLGGRNAGLWAMLAAIWLTAGIRKLFTGSVPGLVTISLMVLTVQTLAAIVTGNLWIFLLHFPLANLGLCLLFARTARGHSPITARLAAEVIGLRCPAIHQQRLNRFFQNVTVLWAGVFLLLAVTLGALLATIPVGEYVPVWAVTTIALIAIGIGASTMWLRSVIREHGIGFRFTPATAAPLPPCLWPRPAGQAWTALPANSHQHQRSTLPMKWGLLRSRSGLKRTTSSVKSNVGASVISEVRGRRGHRCLNSPRGAWQGRARGNGRG